MGDKNEDGKVNFEEFKAFVEAALSTESAFKTEMYWFFVEPFRDGIVTLSEFSEPPKEANALKEKLWKLRVSLYGLKGASLQSHLKSNKNRYKQSQVGQVKFIKEGKLIGIIISHADDFLPVGNG